LESYEGVGCRYFEGAVGGAERQCGGDSGGVGRVEVRRGGVKLTFGGRNADSPTRIKDGEVVFVKPWEEQQSFEEFIDFVTEQEKSGLEEVEEVRYAQTRKYHVIHPLLQELSKHHP